MSWQLEVDSQEVKGKANYLKPSDLSVSLDHLHLYIPGFDEMTKERSSLFASEDQAAPLISNFDRKFHTEMPNLTLSIDDFWLQGYKVGKVMWTSSVLTTASNGKMLTSVVVKTVLT